MKFRDSYDATSREIEAAISIHDTEKAKFLIHKFKGSAGNLGFDEVFKNTERLEKAVSKENWEEITRAWEFISTAFVKFHDSISSFIEPSSVLENENENENETESTATPAESTQSHGIPFDSPEILKLRMMLEKNDYGATDFFRSIKGKLSRSFPGHSAFEEFAAAVSNLDFEKAVELLKSISGEPRVKQ